MDILKCKAFLSSVDSGSFSAAAEQLGYTPSGINRMVNSLEDEIGILLLNRNRKGVTVTDNGKKMIPILRKLVQCNEQALQLSAEIKGLHVGNLNIGTYYSVAAGWLPTILKNFQNDYPGIKVNILEGGNKDLISWIDEGKVDFSILSESNTNYEWIPLKKDSLVVWLPKNHPKANYSDFPINDLNGEPFIKTLPGYNTDLERLLKKKNLSPDIKYTTIDNYSTYSMVAAGLGVSINNKLMAKNWSDDVVILPFNPPQYIILGISLPSIKDASPAAKKFIQYAKKFVEIV